MLFAAASHGSQGSFTLRTVGDFIYIYSIYIGSLALRRKKRGSVLATF